jgi:hypothetical protein
MSDITQARKALVARVLEGKGSASPVQRRAAFDDAPIPNPLGRLIDKVANDASSISDTDVGAVLAAGLSEDRVFEVTICAAVGQATRQYEAALAALNAATKST